MCFPQKTLIFQSQYLRVLILNTFTQQPGNTKLQTAPDTDDYESSGQGYEKQVTNTRRNVISHFQISLTVIMLLQ